MKKLVFAVCLMALGACNVVRDEAGYAGGHIGRVADERLFAARAQQQRADRYLLTLVIVAPLAADLAQDEAGAKAASVLINDAYDKLRLLYEAAGTCLQAVDTDGNLIAPKGSGTACLKTETTGTGDAQKKTPIPSNTAYAFESHTYEMQRTMLALTKQTLGAVELDGLADDIVNLNLVGILKSVRKSVPIARQSLAGFRDVVLTFSDAVQANCTDCDKLRGLVQQVKSGSRADASVLSLYDDRVFRAMLGQIDRAIEKAPTWQLEERHVLGLMYHVDKACSQLLTRQISADDGEVSLDKAENCGKAFKLDGSNSSSASKHRARFLKEVL